MNHPITFKSAVGGFYYAILVIIAATTVIAFKSAFEQQQGLTLLLLLVFTILIGWGLPVWFLVATDYTVTEDVLDIRTGPFKWHINRADIESIKPTRNPLSSPALSLDRLEIRYSRYKYILVSPKDRYGFYRALGFTPQP